MAVAVTVTPTVAQAGKTPTTIAITGATSGQVLAVLISDPEYGSNWTTVTGTAVTQARTERFITCDTLGAASFIALLTYNAQYTITVRPATEQFQTTTASATTTYTPTMQNT